MAAPLSHAARSAWHTLSAACAFLWPAPCLVCGRPLKAGVLCRRCLPKAEDLFNQPRCALCFSAAANLDASQRCELCRMIPPVFNQIRYLWLYREDARDLIACMKYRPSPKLCKAAASMLAETLYAIYPFPDWDLIVPLPSSRRSERERCFNQCLVLARALQAKLSESHPTRLDTFALRHQGCKHAQASLDHSRRISNVKGAFCADPVKVRGARILLVDDVITSGATSATAAVALLEAGAAAVDLIALAKAAVWDQRRHDIYKGVR